MKNIATTEQIADIIDLTVALARPAKVDALMAVAMMRRVVDTLETLRQQLCEEANKSYMELVAKDPIAKSWAIGDFANVVNYTPAGTWVYPDEVQKLINETEKAKALAKKLKTAFTKSADTVDPTTTFLFSVRLDK